MAGIFSNSRIARKTSYELAISQFIQYPTPRETTNKWATMHQHIKFLQEYFYILPFWVMVLESLPTYG